MARKPKLHRLQNGFCIEQVEPGNATMLQHQVCQYFQHGIETILSHKAPLVIDAGANIGLFALEVAYRTAGTATVYSFEPLPMTFSVLQKNLRQVPGSKLVPIQSGLAHINGMQDFSFNPRCSLISSSYGLNLDVLMERVLRIVYDPTLDPAYRQAVPPGLSLIPRWLLQKGLTLTQRVLERKTQRVPCLVQRLSHFLAQAGINQVDLLKIDVEKAEWDVLQGIDEQDWPKIRSLVVEIHDLEDRLKKVQRLLRERGFHRLTIEQEPFYAGTDVFAVYALR